MTNTSLIEKVVTSSSIGTPGDGRISQEQADQFIDYAWDATVLMKEATRKKMNAPEAEWDIVSVGARIARKATEAVDTGENATPNFTKVSLRTEKIRLDWELSSESLEDNIEGQDFDDHLARLFADQFGQDLEDLAINGDTDSTDPLLKTFDGWHKRALESGRVVAGANEPQLSRAHFNQALKAMPRKYVNRKGDLRFYASTHAVQDYLYSQSDQGIVPNEVVQGTLRQSPIPTGEAGYSTNWPFGVELKEVPLFDTTFNEVNAGTGTTNESTSYLELTTPRNRVVGVQRDIKLYRQFDQHKDTVEYTMYFRAGVAFVNYDAIVTVTNITLIP